MNKRWKLFSLEQICRRNGLGCVYIFLPAGKSDLAEAFAISSWNTHMLASHISSCLFIHSRASRNLNSYQLQIVQMDTHNMIMPMLKVTSVIWIITFTCPGPGSPWAVANGGAIWTVLEAASRNLMLSCFNEDIYAHGQHHFCPNLKKDDCRRFYDFNLPNWPNSS